MSPFAPFDRTPSLMRKVRTWATMGSPRGRIGLFATLIGVVVLSAIRPDFSSASGRTGDRMGHAAAFTSDTATIAGPYLFSTPNGSLTTSYEYFTTTVTPGRRYLVRTQKVSGTFTQISVFLNNAGAAATSDLASASVFHRILDIDPVDTLKAIVGGSAGATIRVTVVSVSDPSYVVYGPVRLSVLGGYPALRQDTFTVATGTAGPYHVHWLNGPNGATQASSANIKVNGVTVLNGSGPEFAASGSRVNTLSLPAGQKIVRTEIGGPTGALADVWITATDTTHPKITITAPTPNALTRYDSTDVTGSVQDQTGTAVTVNGVIATMNGASFTARVALPTEGANTLTIRATDGARLSTDSVRTVRRDSQAPTLLVSSPADNFLTNQDSVTVAGTVADANYVTANVNGIALPISTGAFSRKVAIVEGLNVLSVTATDSAGNATTVVRQVRRDTQAPALTVTAPANGFTTSAATVSVTGTVSDASTVTVSANGTPLTIGGGGAFSGSVPVAVGSSNVVTTATDAAGNVASVTRQVTRTGATGPTETVGIDASLGAPALSRMSVTPMRDAVKFLYTGANPVQTGVAANVIDGNRVAVTRGRILDRAGAPLSGVTVNVLGHSEFGQTFSRSNGLFDMAVNGGGVLTVEYTKAGYVPLQRKVSPGWRRYAVLPDVVMTPLDTLATSVNFTAPIAVHRGSSQTDLGGTRRARVFFRQGTQASMLLPGGSSQALSAITVRATELTVGADGPIAMNADLPPTSAYTYAVELSVDQAITANATRVQFTKPVALYVDNFLNFPVGVQVPTGIYDRQKAAWMAVPDGRVVKILGVSGGLATLAVDTSGTAATSTQLLALDITSDERAALATEYAVGATLWRSLTTHFSTPDLNLPSGSDPGSDGLPRPTPNENDPDTGDRTKDGPCEGGSVIECENQTLGESLPLVGVPFNLTYRSDRQLGRQIGRKVTIPLSKKTFISPDLLRIELVVEIAGRRTVQFFPATAGQETTVTWDGLDAFGRAASGAVPISVEIIYQYAEFWGLSPQVVASFGLPCAGWRMTPTGQVCFMLAPGGIAKLPGSFYAVVARSKMWEGKVEAWPSQASSIGGWTLSAHHVYDPTGKMLFRGDGAVVEAEPWQSSAPAVNAGSQYGYSGDGGRARDATLKHVGGITAGADGTVYFADDVAHVIRRITRNDTISTVVGTGTAGAGAPGSSGGQTAVNQPRGLAVGPDGSVFFADNANHRVLKLTPSNLIELVAGTGASGFSGDGGAAASAQLSWPNAVAVANDGTVFGLAPI